MLDSKSVIYFCDENLQYHSSGADSYSVKIVGYGILEERLINFIFNGYHEPDTSVFVDIALEHNLISKVYPELYNQKLIRADYKNWKIVPINSNAKAILRLMIL